MVCGYIAAAPSHLGSFVTAFSGRYTCILGVATRSGHPYDSFSWSRRLRSEELTSGDSFYLSTALHSILLTSVMLSPLPRAFGRLRKGRLLCRSTSGQARPRRRSYRASSTTCTAGSGGNPQASPPKSPDGRAA